MSGAAIVRELEICEMPTIMLLDDSRPFHHWLVAIRGSRTNAQSSSDLCHHL
jgi:hypothetical protein